MLNWSEAPTVPVAPVPMPQPDDDTDLEGPATTVIHADETKDVLIKAMHELIRSRRERVVGGIVNLMMDTFITAEIPPKHFPSVEVFKQLVTQVRALMLAHNF